MLRVGFTGERCNICQAHRDYVGVGAWTRNADDPK